MCSTSPNTQTVGDSTSAPDVFSNGSEEILITPFLLHVHNRASYLPLLAVQSFTSAAPLRGMMVLKREREIESEMECADKYLFSRPHSLLVGRYN